jgi:hypothetical protein
MHHAALVSLGLLACHPTRATPAPNYVGLHVGVAVSNNDTRRDDLNLPAGLTERDRIAWDGGPQLLAAARGSSAFVVLVLDRNGVVTDQLDIVGARWHVTECGPIGAFAIVTSCPGTQVAGAWRVLDGKLVPLTSLACACHQP